MPKSKRRTATVRLAKRVDSYVKRKLKDARSIGRALHPMVGDLLSDIRAKVAPYTGQPPLSDLRIAFAPILGTGKGFSVTATPGAAKSLVKPS